MVETERINPYAPSAEDLDDRNELTFEGVIDERDYAELLPKRDAGSGLFLVLIVLLGLISQLSLFGTVVGAVLNGWHVVLIPLIATFVVATVSALLVFRYSRPLRRAQRILKGRPDYLGSVRGRLTESGLVLSDGIRNYWLGPQQLIAARVSGAGVAVLFSQDAYHFLSLTAKMFDSYSRDVALRLQRAWYETSLSVTQADVPAGLELWNALNPAPEDAIRFQGFVTIQQPLRTPEHWRAVFGESAWTLPFFLIMFFRSSESWVRYGLLVAASFALVWNARNWYRYFRGSQTVSWDQRGWCSPQELAIVSGCLGTRLLLSDLTEFTDHESLIVLNDGKGAAYYLSRDQMQSDSEWVTLKERWRNSVAKVS